MLAIFFLSCLLGASLGEHLRFSTPQVKTPFPNVKFQATEKLVQVLDKIYDNVIHTVHDELVPSKVRFTRLLGVYFRLFDALKSDLDYKQVYEESAKLLDQPVQVGANDVTAAVDYFRVVVGKRVSDVQQLCLTSDGTCYQALRQRDQADEARCPGSLRQVFAHEEALRVIDDFEVFLDEVLLISSTNYSEIKFVLETRDKNEKVLRRVAALYQLVKLSEFPCLATNTFVVSANDAFPY